MPLVTRPARDGTEVSAMPGLPDWTVIVHTDSSVTVRPAPGTSITWADWRRIPIGAVLEAADPRTNADRLADTVHNIGPVPLDGRPPGDARDRLLTAIYRSATAAGVSPRAAISGVYSVPESTAGRWITDLRARGVLGTVREERGNR